MIPGGMSMSDVSHVAQHGSPALLQAVGRVFGLGPNERAAAFGQDGSGVPMWAWVMLATGAGIVIGARVQRRWPRVLPEIIRGA
jgi:hypothetical protein